MKKDNTHTFIGHVSHFFAVHRPLSLLVMFAVLFFGLFAFLVMPKQYNPEIVRPAFLISLTYDGATVEEATDRVVYELVEKIRTVPGVDDVYTEVRDGATIHTTVIFEVGSEATRAKLDLLAQIEQHKYLRSGLVSDPLVQEINPETIPVLQIVFGADGFTEDMLRARVVALSRELGDIAGVSEVSIHGGYTTSLVVEIDPIKLREAGVGVERVLGALQDSQIRMVTGGVENESYTIPLVIDAKTTSASSVGNLVVADGVRLRDVAHVYEGTADEQGYLYYDDGVVSGSAVMLAVSKVEGSSAPVVTRAVVDEIDVLLNNDEYNNLSYVVVGDDGETASNEISGLTKNLLTSIVIVALVLMLFLSVRAAIVVLIAIPMTLLMVFGLGFIAGETINRITLFALILSLGLLVDSAIVVVENIYAHIRHAAGSDTQLSRERVVARAVDEIGVGLLLSTVTSVIVFLPMGYITGMMGPYMEPIAFFVPAALIVSFFVAIIVTPFVAAHLIDVEEKKNVLNLWFSKKLGDVTRLYTRVLGQVLSSRKKQKRLLQGALVLFLLSLMLPFAGLVHFQMLPKADRDQFYVYLDLPVDTRVEATRSVAGAVTDFLLEHEQVISVQSFVGEAPIIDFNGMFKGAQYRNVPYQATLRVNLSAADMRAESSTDITETLRARFAEKETGYVSFVRFMEEPPGPPVRATFVAKVNGASADTEVSATKKLYDLLAGVEGVVDQYTSYEDPVGQVVYRLDREAMATRGVSAASVAQVLEIKTDTLTVAEYLAPNAVEFTPIMVSYTEEAKRHPSDLSGLFVAGTDGEMVPLSELVAIETIARPSRVNLEGATTLTYVTAEVEGRPIVYVMIDVMRKLHSGAVEGLSVEQWGLFSMELFDTETGERVTIDWGGEWEMTLENFRDLGIAMGVALLLVYGVLVAQYNRFNTPAYILVTVPLGLIGILVGFFVLDTFFGVYLTATALIGFIALIGLVVNNAIIFLEYVEQMKEKGCEYKDALLRAGEVRLRPIVLTSLTTILGSLTIASDPVWSGLAWAIVFGLSLSTVLTLVVYPTLLMYFTGPRD